MKRIALKIDVDTCRGTLVGVPALIDLLQRHAASATFFFALGPDCSGREAHKSSPSRLYESHHTPVGTAPAGSRYRRACCRQDAPDAGCRFRGRRSRLESLLWERRVLSADNAWVEAEMAQAWRRFEAIFGAPPVAHGAAGWRMNRHALRLTQRLGLCYASDCRGKYPFFPVIDGEIVRCPQIPTTLPTIDELLLLGAASADQAVEQVLEASTTISGDHVFTLRAELEGITFSDAFESLLVTWQERGHRLVALRDLLAARNVALPCHTVAFAEIAGRTGPRMLQGRAFLEE